MAGSEFPGTHRIIKILAVEWMLAVPLGEFISKLRFVHGSITLLIEVPYCGKLFPPSFSAISYLALYFLNAYGLLFAVITMIIKVIGSISISS